MPELGPHSPSMVWRQKSVRLKLEVAKCNECGKGHISSPPICQNSKREFIPILNTEGEIYVAEKIKEGVIS